VEGRVQLYVLAVVKEEVELDIGVARTIQESLIEVICFRRNSGCIFLA
jgi:hypothetical protein